MNLSKRFIFIFQILFTLFSINLYSQNASPIIINYYGVLSSDLDSNMSKMTSDLYFTQLTEFPSVEVKDLRNTNTSSVEGTTFLTENNNLYFIVRKQEDSSKWILSMYLHNNTTNRTLSETKEYDSFYKILMEPKSSLKETIKTLLDYNLNKINSNESTLKSQTNNTDAFPDFKSNNTFVSTEEFSGTWIGENFIDKIVILRGGRGFVIFNNGASMNISVKIEEKDNERFLVIKQTSRANASFYPDLDRQKALLSLENATPIEWRFTTISTNSISGTKRTLIQTSDGLNIQEAEIEVTWNRKL